MAELVAHEQQREPKMTAEVVDTLRAVAGVSDFPLLSVAKATHKPSLALKDVALKAWARVMGMGKRQGGGIKSVSARIW